MASTSSAQDSPQNDFNHQLAIKLSRVMNLVNPNDLLATRVTDIAKTNSEEGFIKGAIFLDIYMSLHLP